MQEISVELCQTLPPKQALNNVLNQYYTLIVERMTAVGLTIDPAAPQSALAEFWANSNAYMPPTGRLAIATTPEGTLVGCGMLKTLDHQTGELKRDFVTAAARGTGTGRALLQARIDAARQMGMTRLVADTLTPNVEMRSLYPKLGFRELDTVIETTTYQDQPMLRPHMHFFEMDLTQ